MCMKERNVGIDILKFLAVLLITNSHMALLYGKYSALATGGTLGNVLFFFCSGFTLFLKPFDSVRDFPNWYKHRINRIYPAVLAIAIVRCTFFDAHRDINWIILHGGRWFVTYIMVYYVFIYFIGLYCRKKIIHVMALIAAVTCIWFFSMDRPFPFSMYGDERIYLTWPLYFIFMLFGAKMGMMSQSRSTWLQATGPQWRNLTLGVLSVVAFYVMCGVTERIERVAFLHIFSFIPLLLFIYFIYLWGNGRFVRSIYNGKVGNFVIRFVGGLCLEVYLIQNSLLTDKLNFLFPLNILIFFVIVVIAAYLLRCLARLISQTFKDSPYDWKKMVSKY